jgi:hypothetical protein
VKHPENKEKQEVRCLKHSRSREEESDPPLVDVCWHVRMLRRLGAMQPSWLVKVGCL